MDSVMIDIEAVGLKPGCALLQVGAVEFDAYGEDIGKKFITNVGLEASISAGLKVEPNTLEWWLRDKHHMFYSMAFPNNPDRLTLSSHLQALSEFYRSVTSRINPDTLVWAQGTVYDIAVLEFCYRLVGIEIPWSFHSVRDARTILSVHGDLRDKSELIEHDALNDCIIQAKGIQRVLGTRDKEPD